MTHGPPVPPRSAADSRLRGRRLLFVVNDAGNVLTHRRPLVQATLDAGMEVHVAAPPSPLGPDVEQLGCTLHPYPLSRRGMNPLQELASLRALRRLYLRLRPDLVQHATIKPILYGGLAARLVHLPAVAHLVTGLGHSFSARGPIAAGLRAGILGGCRVALRHPRQVVFFQNPEDCALFVSHRVVPASQCEIVPGSGVDIHRFAPTPEPPGPPVFLLPARLLRNKGIPEFLAAARRLRTEGVPARFVLAGGLDPDNPAALTKTEVETMVRDGVVEWIGHQPSMGPLLASCHVVCLPSRYREGIPKSLLEGAAAGRPLLATDTPGCREVVRDGDNGLLVPPGDVAALATAMRVLAEDAALRIRMGARSRARAVAEFSAGRVTGQMLDAYARLLSDRAAAPAGS